MDEPPARITILLQSSLTGTFAHERSIRVLIFTVLCFKPFFPEHEKMILRMLRIIGGTPILNNEARARPHCGANLRNHKIYLLRPLTHNAEP